MNKKIEQSILSLGKQLKDSELISTSFMLSKLKKYASENPQDKTIGSLKIVFANLENNKKGFITRKELKDLYSKHYTFKTSFASLFENELGEKEIEPEIKTAQNIKPLDFNKYAADESLVKLMGGLIKENTGWVSADLVKKAERKIASDLNFLDYAPKSVKVLESNKDILLAVASFETPKGLTEVYVPMTSNLEASVFIGNNAVDSLNKESLAKYIVSNSGQRLKTASKQVFDQINAYFKPKESKTELAITSLKVSKAKESLNLTNPILAYKIAENKETIVEIPKSNEFSSLEEKFASPVGIALENFGEKGLQKAASVLESTLNQVNSPPLKIKVAGSTSNTINFDVQSKSGKTYSVGVKMAGSNPLSPEFAIVNGYVRKINASFESSLNEESLDKKSFANISNLSLMSGEQLISFAKNLLENKELSKLEIVLEAIKEKDLDLYKNAYKLILTDGLTKQASTIHKCAKLITSPNSIHKVCSHTGLPENKIYVDQNGNCRQIHSKDIVAETGFFSTARILG